MIVTEHTLNPWMNETIKDYMKLRDKFREMINYNTSNKKNIDGNEKSPLRYYSSEKSVFFFIPLLFGGWWN